MTLTKGKQNIHDRFLFIFDNIGSLKVGETFYKLQSLSILAMYDHC